ncbi:MAG: glycosyltransferase family 39 protein [Ktedonobacteraceae bacterium]|nr:glycosyltransferase family 39 protein [Ktedonobacteraceae bacterium]
MIETSLTQSSVETKKILQKRALTDKSLARWSLPLILVFQAVIAWMLLQNTAFQDEALYVYAGQQLLEHWFSGLPLLDNYSYYFSGNPYLYPLIAGALNMIGGLQLVRVFSTLCMLIVTACAYYVTKKLFNQPCAVFAAIFLVCQGPILFLSRLATYDPLCICLLAIGMALAVKTCYARRPWWALTIGPILILAFGTKYAALLFIPSILTVLVLCTFLQKGWVSTLIRGSLAGLSVVAAGAVAVFLITHFDRDMLHALGATTTNRVVEQGTPRLTLIIHVVEMIGLPYGVALVSLFFARKKQLLVVLLLLGSTLLVPAYHIYKYELISLDKHLGFSMFFAAPVAGYALASLSGFWHKFSSGRYWVAGVSVCLVLFFAGVQEAQNMYTGWPDTTQLAYMLNTQVRSGNGHYLMEQYEVSRYNLRDDTYNWQWIGLDFFQYTDKQGHYYVGDPAYAQAINDGYFDIIQLNYGFDHATAMNITNDIKQSNKYELVAKIPFRDVYGTGYFSVWRKR